MLNVMQICMFILLSFQIAFGKSIFVVYDAKDASAVQIRQQLEPTLSNSYDNLAVFDYKSNRLSEFIEKLKPDAIIAINQNAADSLIKIDSVTPLSSPLFWIANEPFNVKFAHMSYLTHQVLVPEMYEGAWKRYEIPKDNYKTYSANSFVSDLDTIVRESRFQTQAQFGTLLGVRASGVQEAIKALDAEFPSDLEVILGHRTIKMDAPNFFKVVNPFGHISIRIRDTVYTVNYKTNPGEDPFHLRSNLADYLTSTVPGASQYEFIGMHGQAYGREHIGLRIGNISDAELNAMEDEFKKLEVEFVEGKTKYISCSTNCADFVYRVLKLIVPEMPGPRFIAFPSAVFDSTLKTVTKRKFPFRLVKYGHVNAPASMHFKSGRALGAGAPVQLLLESIGRWLGKTRYTYEDTRDVNAQLFYSSQKQKMVYENLDKRHKQYCIGFYSGGKSG